MVLFYNFNRESTYDAEFNFLLRGDEGRLKEAGLVKVDGLTPQQAEAAVKLSKFTAFNNLMKNIQTSEVSYYISILNLCDSSFFCNVYKNNYISSIVSALML